MIVSSVRLLTLIRIRAFFPAAAAVAVDQPLAQVERRDQELAEPRRPAKAGQ
jgi:hypothetical protein